MSGLDLIIANGTVIDPESKTSAQMNLGIKAGKIAYLGKDLPQCSRIIDVHDYIVTPGFIDIHAHEDIYVETGKDFYPLPVETAKALLHTGVTTMVGGNCGLGVFPTGPFLEKAQKSSLSCNYVSLIGYITLREMLGIDKYVSATAEQINKMAEMVKEGLSEGALGVSFGLQYAPGISLQEFIEISKIVKEHDKLVAVHMRYDYPAKAWETVQEVITVAQKTGVRIQISNLAANVYGGDNLDKVLALLRSCNERGLDVRADTYPYNAWATSLKSSVFDDGVENFNFNLEDIEILTGPHAEKRCTAKLFSELRESREDTMVACHNAIPQNDLEKCLISPLVSICSDGQLYRDEHGNIKGHPRSAGSPARFIGEYVRNKGLLSLDEAVRKLTLEPAERLKLSSKGRLQVGADADITIFDYQEIIDRSSFGINVCASPPSGIKYVIVGGQVNLER